ncbi:MAG: SlyX family protein [Gammaproteobacteria bacterium]|nr:SlyX family protein [Gammaproteobacteria bacterium]
MNTDNLEQRMEDLEIRIAHMEASMDELTHANLGQERMLRLQEEVIKRLSQQLRAINPADGAESQYETPPHY